MARAAVMERRPAKGDSGKTSPPTGVTSPMGSRSHETVVETGTVSGSNGNLTRQARYQGAMATGVYTQKYA